MRHEDLAPELPVAITGQVGRRESGERGSDERQAERDKRHPQLERDRAMHPGGCANEEPRNPARVIYREDDREQPAHRIGDEIESSHLEGIEGADPAAADISETFEEFYVREFPAMVALAYALSGSRTASEDLAQEALLACRGQKLRSPL